MTGAVDLRDLLPHRWPMLLIDRVVTIVPGEAITAVKAVTGNEPWYDREEHSRAGGDLAYPQVLQVESWAQAAGVLVNSDSGGVGDADRIMLFGGAADIEFFGRVYPGDVLEHRIRIMRRFPDTVIFCGESLVGGALRMRVGTMTMAFRPSSQLTAARAPVGAGAAAGSGE